MPNSPDTDRIIAAVARNQLALVTLDQLRDRGVSHQRVRDRVHLGRLERVYPRVYRVAGAPQTHEQRLLAACLCAGAGAVVSHRAAAFVWGLSLAFGGVVEITLTRTRQTAPTGAIRHRSTDLSDDHVTRHRGLPVTTPARTLVDLGAVVPQWVLDRAIDEALAKRLVELDDLLTILHEVARRGRRGVGPLRRSLAMRKGVPDSVLDGELERLLARHGLDAVMQHEVLDRNGRFVARVDAAFPDVKLAIEADGAATRVGRAALHYDVARQNALMAEGWSVLRYTWHDIVMEPERVVGEIRAAIRRRRRELGLEMSA